MVGRLCREVCRLCTFSLVTRPFPFMGKEAVLKDIPPSRCQKVEQPGLVIKSTPPNGSAMHL